MLEGLALHWGFYFVAKPDPKGVGVTDLSYAMDFIRQHPEWKEDLSELAPEQRSSQHDANRQITTDCLKRLLVARILVFEAFLEEAIQLDGKLEAKHRHFWLLFQLFEKPGTVACPDRTEHPFLHVLKCLEHISHEVIETLVNRMLLIHSTHIAPGRFVIGLDEIQHAVRRSPSCFMTSGGKFIYRSMLQEIVTVLKLATPDKLVVLGTGLSQRDIKEEMTAISGASVIVFHKLGLCDSSKKLQALFQQYVPPSILRSPSGVRLERRMREYLVGR